MAKLKVQARSSRIAVTNPSAFGFGANSASEGERPPSTLSYYAELPNISAISNPNVVVFFRNLFKKDSTTKARALEDLQTYLDENPQDVEDAVLEAWIGIYPRASIDVSRRVRQLAHVIQAKVAAAVGKRILKHLPSCIGAWLLGLYDSDKLASNAAKTGLERVFPSPEKRKTLRKAYQEALLDFCLNIIQHETPITLSYEPAVGPAEAAAKYNRTLAASIKLISELLELVAEEDIRKFVEKYQHLADDQKLWGNVTNEDSSVRRGIHKLLRTCLENPAINESFNPSHLSSWYVSKGLESDQSGSATEYLETLVHLTHAYPSIWTSHWSGKKPPHVNLRHFLRKGSQSGPPIFWTKLGTMLSNLPKETFPDTLEGTTSLLKALQNGLTRREEPRSYLGSGLKAFLHFIPIVSSQLSIEDQKANLVSTIKPLVDSLLFVTGERAWDVPEISATDLLKEIIRIDFVSDTLVENWRPISETLVVHLRTLLPESSPDYDISQHQVGSESQRWAIATSMLYRSDFQSREIPEAVRYVIKEAIDVLVNRNGKPYGAATAIGHITTHCKDTITKDPDTLRILDDFLVTQLPAIFLSRSSSPLAVVLKSLNETPSFGKSWRLCLAKIIESIDTGIETSAIRALFKALPRNSKELLSVSLAEIQQLLLHYLELALDDKKPWDGVIEFLAAIGDESLDAICLRTMTTALSQPSERTKSAVRGFLELCKRQPRKAQEWSVGGESLTFVSSVLRLTEISDDDELAQAAKDLSVLIDSTISSSASVNNDSRVAVIHQELNAASVESVWGFTLAQQAGSILKDRPADSLSALIPNTSIWESELLRFMTKLDEYIISSPKGAAFLYRDDFQTEHLEHAERDSTGLSIPIRMAVYTVQLLNDADWSLIEEETMSAVLKLLVQTTILAEQKISVETANALWFPHTPENEADMVEFISQSQKLVFQWLKSSDWWRDETVPSKFDFVRRTLSELYSSVDDDAPPSYFASRAYCQLTNELINIHGISTWRAEDVAKQLAAARRSNVLRSQITYLSAHNTILSSIPFAKRWYNEMVSDLMDISMSDLNDSAIGRLTLFQTTIMGQDPSLINTAASQRRAFLVRRLVEALESDGPVQYQVLSLATLNTILPTQLAMYGEHWEVVVSFIKRLWFQTQNLNLEQGDHTLSLLFESLKLHSALRNMATTEDCNEDLQEALQDSEMERYSGLLNLMSLERSVPDDFHAPLRMVNMNLSRELDKIPLDFVTEPEMLFHVLNSNSDSLQTCGFTILHAKIPTLQQALSIEAALEKSAMRLPDELLSLVLESPKMSHVEDLDPDERLPLRLKGYFLSWILIFDYFEDASHILRNQYSDCIKEGGYINGLLEFVFEYLGHSTGKPISADGINPTSTDLDYGNATRGNLQYLLIHIYYLSLLHVSSLVKAWWMDCKSRRTVQLIESWTAKYMSPRIIASALQAVQEWSRQQEGVSTDDGRPLTIKVNIAASEVLASYAITGDDDEHPLAMLVKLPPTFPLHQAEVRSASARTTFEERRWKGWLRSAQGVIAFSNNSVVDGLLAWRRNVVGALQGRSECTICYSLVGEDGKLPTRRCKTCKNSFHLVCLTKWFASSGNRQCPLCRSDFANMSRG